MIETIYRGERFACGGTAILTDNATYCSVCDKPDPLVVYELSIARNHDEAASAKYFDLKHLIKAFNETEFPLTNEFCEISAIISRGNVHRTLIYKNTRDIVKVNEDWTSGIIEDY